MANLTSRLIISLIDRVSGPARAMQGALAGLHGVAGRRGISGGMMGASAALATQMRGLNRNATGTAAMSTGLALIGRSGFEAAYSLEKVMNNVQAVGMLSDEQRNSLKAYIQELNNAFPFINKEIGEAAFELFRAGFNYEQAIGALKGTLLLAQAGDIGRQEAADIATNVLTAMRLPMQTTEQAAASMARVNDTLAYAANKSNTDVRLLGETFKYVAPLAASAGMSIEQVAAAAMTMANNGIKGSEAGVAMRSAIVRMAKPTKDMMATLGRLDINIGDFITGGRKVTADDIVAGLMTSGIDASGQKKAIEAMLADKVMALKPGQMVANLVDLIAKDAEGAADKNVLAETIGDILTASGKHYDLLGFTRALREKGVGVAEISRIMDIRQGARVLTLLLADLDAKTREIEQYSRGAAQKMADIRMKGIVGEVARLKAAWENLWVAIGNAGVLSTLGSGFESLANGLKAVAQSNPALLKFGTYAMIALGVIGPLGILAGGMVSAFRMLGGILKVVGLGLGIVAMRMAALARIGRTVGGAAGMAGLFGAGAAGAVASTKAGRAMAAGMTAAGKAAANNAVGARMIAGMTAAAGGGIAAAGAGSKAAAFAKLGAKGLSRLFWPLTLGLMAWDAYEGWQKTGTLGGAALNAATLGLYTAGSPASAATLPQGAGAHHMMPQAAGMGAADADLQKTRAGAQAVEQQVQSMAANIRAIVGAIDLTADGQRIAESLAAGLRAGAGAVAAAANEVLGAQVRGAVRGSFSDGGR